MIRRHAAWLVPRSAGHAEQTSADHLGEALDVTLEIVGDAVQGAGIGRHADSHGGAPGSGERRRDAASSRSTTLAVRRVGAERPSGWICVALRADRPAQDDGGRRAVTITPPRRRSRPGGGQRLEQLPHRLGIAAPAGRRADDDVRDPGLQAPAHARRDRRVVAPVHVRVDERVAPAVRPVGRVESLPSPQALVRGQRQVDPQRVAAHPPADLRVGRQAAGHHQVDGRRRARPWRGSPRTARGVCM